MNASPEHAIRRLTVDDLGALQALRREALSTHPLAFGSSPEEDRLLDDALAAATVSNPLGAVFGAFGPELAGMVGVLRAGPQKMRHRASIWGMYVQPHARGQRFGRSLLEAAVDHARRWSGVTQVHLSVTTDAPEARALYESAGFEAWGTEPMALLWRGQFSAEVHMVLSLGGATGLVQTL